MRENAKVRGYVLVLPGGKPESVDEYQPWRLAGLRTALVTRAIRAELAPGYVVEQLDYRYRGWNAPDLPAVRDGESALRSARNRFGPVPVVLVGHSMGGRVAAHLAGGHEGEAVIGVVALAPWWPNDEGRLIPAGTKLQVLHGTADRWTDPVASRRQTEHAAARGVQAEWQAFDGAGHFMLNRPWRWHQLTADAVAAMLSAN